MILVPIERVIEIISDMRCECNFFKDGRAKYEALSELIQRVQAIPSEGDCTIRYEGEHFRATYHPFDEDDPYQGERDRDENGEIY